MKSRDTRQLNLAAQTEKRAIAFRIREQGYTQKAIAAVVEVHRSTLKSVAVSAISCLFN
ncbi:hypothetical protein [Thiofilum flexile]|uniref:hypothetical protein n=1 Tax=Thiofilum flexile TaxID=125627 RepID=UPI0003666A5B|nr:hypothetical protein [Thiofilum flexile]